MEHKLINEWAGKNKINIDNSNIEKLAEYSHLICINNKKFNLTGFKTCEEILTGLILPCIPPITQIYVPRGTSFVDIGTGSGIPGIPICIINKDITGTLIDANKKKINFVNKVIKKLDLENIRTLCGRVEDFCKEPGLRESFDWVFTRAMGSIYAVLEMGIPLLAVNGNMYMYSKVKMDEIGEKILKQAKLLGAKPAGNEEYNKINIKNNSLLFKKTNTTDPKYPRRFSTIKKKSQNMK